MFKLWFNTNTGKFSVRSFGTLRLKDSFVPKHVDFRFPGCRMSSSLSDSFEDAKKKLNLLKEEPGNDVKLKLYALFKQATTGVCNTTKPKAFDFVGKAKWDAWNSLGSLSQDDAKKHYVSLVNSLVGEDAQPTKNDLADTKYEGILYSVEDGITKIILNRPQKKNAITVQMYHDISAALKEASENDTALTLFTGNGDFYSSGNDLSNFSMGAGGGDISKMARDAGDLLRDFVASFIDFPKVLVAAVNGPAVGIPVTLLGLFDIVYASDKATFHTPFSTLGQSPEGCSTYTFPKIMGYGKANEFLLLNKKLTAAEAERCGLVTEVFPAAEFEEKVSKHLKAACEASKNSMIYSKKLSRDVERSVLHEVNVAECDRLVERWQSQDCMEAIMKFFQTRGKL